MNSLLTRVVYIAYLRFVGWSTKWGEQQRSHGFLQPKKAMVSMEIAGCGGKLVVLLPMWLSAFVFVLSLWGDKLVLVCLCLWGGQLVVFYNACVAVSLCDLFTKKKKRRKKGQQVCAVLCLCGGNLVCLISQKKKKGRKKKRKNVVCVILVSIHFSLFSGQVC